MAMSARERKATGVSGLTATWPTHETLRPGGTGLQSGPTPSPHPTGPGETGARGHPLPLWSSVHGIPLDGQDFADPPRNRIPSVLECPVWAGPSGPARDIVAPDPGGASAELRAQAAASWKGGSGVVRMVAIPAPPDLRPAGRRVPTRRGPCPTPVLRRRGARATHGRRFSGSLSASRLTRAAPRRWSRGAGRDRTLPGTAHPDAVRRLRRSTSRPMNGNPPSRRTCCDGRVPGSVPTPSRTPAMNAPLSLSA